MNNLINLEELYEEYRKNNFYIEYDKKVNKLMILVLIITTIIFTPLMILNVNFYFIIILFVFFVAIVGIGAVTYSLSIINNWSFIKSLKCNLMDIKKHQKSYRIRTEKLLFFSKFLEKNNITTLEQLIFLSEELKDLINEKKQAKKTVFNLISIITTVLNVVTMIVNVSNEVQILIIVVSLTVYYFIDNIYWLISTLLNKNKIDIYLDLQYDVHLKILNYNKKLT